MSQTQPSADTDPLVEALRQKANHLTERLDDLEAENESLRERVDTLEARVPEPSAVEYERLDKHDKATIIRQKLADTASSTNGKASMQYKDVIAVFDGNPSAGHAYDIMNLAGQIEGFKYGSSPKGEKRLIVTLENVKDRADLSRRE